jgi:hypothetical protein
VTDLDDSFAKLLGQQPSDKQRQELYRVRDALGLQGNDALWLVLMALQYYEHLYEQVPARIAGVATATLQSFQSAARAAAETAASETTREFERAVTAVARRATEHMGGRDRLRWLCATAAACVFGVGSVAIWMDARGREAGYERGYLHGYREARDEKAAVCWAVTPEGQVAYRLAKAGSLRQLASCSAPGWYVDDGTCYPAKSSKGLYGFRIEPR